MKAVYENLKLLPWVSKTILIPDGLTTESGLRTASSNVELSRAYKERSIAAVEGLKLKLSAGD